MYWEAARLSGEGEAIAAAQATLDAKEREARRELMEAVDLDGGGDIDFEEFMEWWNDDSQVGRRYKR